MFLHTGTHVDALNHIGYGGTIFNGFTEAEHLGSRHWHRAGVDRHPPVITRGVLLDVAALHGVDELPPSHSIGPADLEATLARQGTELRRGDVVLIRTGRMRAWPDAERFVPDEPGLDLDGARMLAERGAVLIGADNVGLERHPSPDPDNWQPVHGFLLAEAGIPIMEIVDLQELGAARRPRVRLHRGLPEDPRRDGQPDPPARAAAQDAVRDRLLPLRHDVGPVQLLAARRAEAVLLAVDLRDPQSARHDLAAAVARRHDRVPHLRDDRLPASHRAHPASQP